MSHLFFWAWSTRLEKWKVKIEDTNNILAIIVRFSEAPQSYYGSVCVTNYHCLVALIYSLVNHSQIIINRLNWFDAQCFSIFHALVAILLIFQFFLCVHYSQSYIESLHTKRKRFYHCAGFTEFQLKQMKNRPESRDTKQNTTRARTVFSRTIALKFLSELTTCMNEHRADVAVASVGWFFGVRFVLFIFFIQVENL